MSIFGREASGFSLGLEAKVNGPCGALVVECIARDVALDRYVFRWRFDGDSAWARIEADGGNDVIDKIIDIAGDIFMHTGRRQQPDITRPMWRPGKSEPEPLTCRFCGDTHEIQRAKLGKFQIETCPNAPRDQPIALDFSKLMRSMEKRLHEANAPDWSGLEAWLPVEGADHRDVYFGREVNARPVSKAEDDMRKRGEMNRRRGILKHGPFGSGESGLCDADCVKCAAQRENAGHFTVRYMVRVPNGEMQDVSKEEYDRASAAASAKSARADRLFLAAQREDGQAASAISLQEIEEASRRWAAQLRLKVEESKRCDAEAARYTPYWSPEEQSGGDL